MGLRELTARNDQIRQAMSPAVTALETAPCSRWYQLSPTAGRTPSLLFYQDQKISGLITQTDLLAFLAREMNRYT